MGMGDPYASADHLSPSSILEKYTLDGSDNIIRFVNGNNVVLSLESQTEARVRDSARVHTKVISDYKGDVRALSGRFLAVQGDLIAFRFFNENTGEVVRVIDRVSRNRHLIKGFRKSPIDLQYAPHAPLLAVLDSESSLYVYTVANDCQDVVKYINIVNWPEDISQEPRLVWCPYVPENPSDPSDSCNMLAIYKGRKVFVINLTILKGSSSNSQIDFEEASKVEDAILSVEMNEDVTTVCISPDSTAVAIGTAQGIVSFYIVNGSELKFAHNWDPQLNRSIVGLFFLDDTRNLKNQEPFWRHCLAVGEGGRHMALFECEQWHCLGLLRFDSPLDLTRFDVHVDPQARYINILDPDGANVFFVELRQGQPRFTSITQVTFCHPVVSVIPYDVVNVEKNESITDFSLDDDYDSEGRNEVTAHYIAIGHKSLLQLDVQLEKSEINSEGMAPIKAECQVEGQRSSTEGPSDLLTVATTNTLQLDKSKLVEQLHEITEKIDQLSVRLDRADIERRSAATNEHILVLLQSFKEEFSLREDRLLANISDLIETNRTETINVVRNALNENSVAVENSIQANLKQSSDAISQRVSERMRESLAAVVVPAIERICAQLFKQLNENFRLGLEQYMQQMRALQTAALAAVAASATPAPSIAVAADRQALAQMIKTNQVPLAFETALNQGDQAALEFVCNNVDPDAVFAFPAAMSQPVLLSLLQQLSLRLDSDTDLKFRYMEHIMEVLQPYDEEISIMVPKVLESLGKSLTDFQNLTNNAALRRQARVINQLIRNMAKI